MVPLRILVTGVTGYIGDALVPRLLRDGHDVRGFARDASRVRSGVRTVEGDAVSGTGLAEALDGIDVAYFLIHSMEGQGTAKSFDRLELQSVENFAAAAQLQVLFGYAKAVGRFAHQREARPPAFAERIATQQHAGRFRRAAPYAPAQLVKLCQTEALGLFDDDQRCVGYVDADFDDRRRDEYRQLAPRERRHHSVFLGRLHPAMNQADRIAEAQPKRHRARLGCGTVLILAFLDERADPERLLALRDMRGEAVEHHEADVMPGVFILAAWIAKADDEVE